VQIYRNSSQQHTQVCSYLTQGCIPLVALPRAPILPSRTFGNSVHLILSSHHKWCVYCRYEAPSISVLIDLDLSAVGCAGVLGGAGNRRHSTQALEAFRPQSLHVCQSLRSPERGVCIGQADAIRSARPATRCPYDGSCNAAAGPPQICRLSILSRG